MNDSNLAKIKNEQYKKHLSETHKMWLYFKFTYIKD